MLESGDPVRRLAAEQLLEENLVSADTPKHEKVWALGILARDAHARHDVETAERLFRLELSIPTESGRGAEDEIEFAEILIAKGTGEALDEARKVLDECEANPQPFVRSQFRLAVAQAKLSMLAGDARRARTFAQAALDLSRETTSGLAHHPRLGLVEAEVEAVAWLRSVALGSELGDRAS